MQSVLILIAFLGKENQKYPLITTRINAMSILSWMECGVYSPFQTHTIKWRGAIFFYISLDFPWNKWNNMYRVFRKALSQISMWFRNWRGQEDTWGVLYQIIFFSGYWHWCHWQQPYLRSMFPLWLMSSAILIILWWILWTTWRV